VFVLNVFVRFVCICVKWFCEMCVCVCVECFCEMSDLRPPHFVFFWPILAVPVTLLL